MYTVILIFTSNQICRLQRYMISENAFTLKIFLKQEDQTKFTYIKHHFIHVETSDLV